MPIIASIAKHAFEQSQHGKPHSSVTEWVDILTSTSYDGEAYDGIPELIDAIAIQPATGTTEASRAIRKKIKHGNTHQQYRAIVILNALVENAGQKFQTSFADGPLVEALKNLATDPATDQKVRRRTLAALAGWHRQFADDRAMATVAGLYRQVKPPEPPRRPQVDRAALEEEERKRREAKAEAKQKAKQEKEKAKAAEEARRRKAKEPPWTQSKAFNFEAEKPKVLEAIATASSSANNLVNAITLVNTEQDSVLTNERVQECLAKVKQDRKPIVRYIQLVENEEFIGTLIDTNERIITALNVYDKLSNPTITEQDVESVQKTLEATQINSSEVSKLQQKQRAAIQRAAGRSLIDDESSSDVGRSSRVHPDLHDLSFGELGSEQRNLPPPIRPNSGDYSSDENRHGSLSDYSDYQSSDEASHNARAGPSASTRDHDTEDPFADPFAD